MSKGKLLAVCLIWLVIFGIGAIVWRTIFGPDKLDVVEEGSSGYDYNVTIALDGFSGYAVLRSEQFKELLRKERIKLELDDDGADYAARLESLQSGRVQMAAFTIDALIKAMADSGDSPAKIVALIDETRGADAMVAYKSTVENVADLNDPETRFVVTPNSPSETLARVVMSNFALDQLPADPFEPADGAEDVLERYLQSKKDSPKVFVLWEPYVSRILANDAMHVVFDSSRFTGYIVDCLVAENDFVSKYPEVTDKIVECYFRALYEFQDSRELKELVKTDAAGDDGMTDQAVEKVVQGIEWKTTQQNFAHFALEPQSNIQYLEDMIDNITNVLLETGAIDADPTGGSPQMVYMDRPLRKLLESDFHPESNSSIPGAAPASVPLRALSDQQWESLEEVGTIRVPKLSFARGRHQLRESSQRTLDDLVEHLKSWPRYYVIVRGNASRKGDLEANQELALRRSKVAEEYLTSHGVDSRRIRAIGVEPSGETNVSFVLGQLPY